MADNESAVQTEPWKPATMLDLPKEFVDKYPDMKFRFINKDASAKKLLEGWVLVELTKEELEWFPHRIQRTLIDSKISGSHVELRELILAKMPKSRVAERAKYYEKLNNMYLEQAVQNVEKIATSDPNYKGGTYGSVNITTSSNRKG